MLSITKPNAEGIRDAKYPALKVSTQVNPGPNGIARLDQSPMESRLVPVLNGQTEALTSKVSRCCSALKKQRVTISMAVDTFMKIDTVDGEAQDCDVALINKEHGPSRRKVLSSNNLVLTNQLPPAPSSGSQVNL